MSKSLAYCLDQASTGTIESARIILASKTYEAKGFTVKEANLKAVREAIKTLEAERVDVVKQIREQVPGWGEKAEAGPDYEAIWNSKDNKEQAKLATAHRRELNAKEKRKLGKEVSGKAWNELSSDMQESLKKWIGREEFEKPFDPLSMLMTPLTKQEEAKIAAEEAQEEEQKKQRNKITDGYIREAEALIKKHEAIIADWSSRVYKETKIKYDKKDEHGQWAGKGSVQVANERRRKGVIRTSQKAIAEQQELIEKLKEGVQRRETDRIMAETSGFDPGPDYQAIWDNKSEEEQIKLAAIPSRGLDAKERRKFARGMSRKWHELPKDLQDNLKKWISQDEFEKTARIEPEITPKEGVKPAETGKTDEIGAETEREKYFKTEQKEPLEYKTEEPRAKTEEIVITGKLDDVITNLSDLPKKKITGVLEQLFGNEETLNDIEGRLVNDETVADEEKKQLRIADEYMADMERAMIERSEDDIEHLLRKYREARRDPDFGKWETPDRDVRSPADILAKRSPDFGSRKPQTKRPEETGALKFSKSKQKITPLSTVVQVKNFLVKALGKRKFKNLIESGKVKIVETEADLKSMLEKEGVKFSEDDTINGMFWHGTTYLVAENLTEQTTYPILLHEILHSEIDQNGYKGLFGKRHDQIKAQFERMLKKGHAGLLAAQKKAEEAGTSEEHMWEETLAYFVQDSANHKTSLFKRILRAVRAWAVRAGLKKEVTVEDLVALAEAAVRRQAKVIPDGRMAETGLAPLINEFAQEVGIKLSTAKKKITDNPNFRKWFGTSQVVNDDGEPLVCYHGTDQDFTIFEFGWRLGHIWGNGFYFTASKEDAKKWAETGSIDPEDQKVMPVYLTIKKPLYLESDSSDANIIESLPEDFKEKLREQLDEESDKNLLDALDGEYIEDFEIEKLAEEIVSYAEDFGYDGVIGSYDGVDHYMAFANTQIKSIYNKGTFDPKNPDIRYDKQKSPEWYSRLGKLIGDHPTEKQSAKAWVATLQSWKKKKLSPALQEELEWSGLIESLELMGKQKVTKQYIQNMIEVGGVKVETEILGEGVIKDWKMIRGRHRSQSTGYTITEKENNRFVVKDFNGIFVGESKNLHKAKQVAANKNTEDDTEHSDKVLPDGKNYKEIFISLPSEEITGGLGWKEKGELDDLQEMLFQTPKQTLRKKELIKKEKEYKEDLKTQYTPTHFPEKKNLLVHLRVDERTDSEGNRVLFINEVQSDFAKDIREQKVKGTFELLPGWTIKEEIKYVGDQYLEKTGYRVVDSEGVSQSLTHLTRENAIRDALGFERGSEGVPDAPFVKSDTAWSMLGLKKAIHYAASQGINKIAWPATVEQVYEIEQWGEVIREDGRYKNQDGEGDVTAIVQRYLRGLPRDANRFLKFQKTGVTVQKDALSDNELVNSIDISSFAEKVQREGVPLFSMVGKKTVAEKAPMFSKSPKPKSYQVALEKYQKRQATDTKKTTQNLIKHSPGATEETKTGLSEAITRAVKDRLPGQSRLGVLQETLTPAFNKYAYWILDKNRPIKVIQRKLKKITENIDVFLKETGRSKIVGYKTKRAWKDQFLPLIKQIARAKLSLPDVELFAHATHVVKDNANQQLRNAHSLANLEELLDIYRANVQEVKEENPEQAKEIKRKIKDITAQMLEIKQEAKPPKGVKAIPAPPRYYDLLIGELAQISRENEQGYAFKQNVEVFYKKPAGMTDKEAVQILEDWKGNTEIEDIRRQITAINRDRLDILREAGLLTAEEYKAYTNKYHYYVPLHREGFEGDTSTGIGVGLQPTGRQIKTRGGSLRNVVDIFGNTVKNYETAIAAAEKAVSTRALKALVEVNPLPGFWRLKGVPKAPRYDSQGNLREYPDMNQKVDNEFQFTVDGKRHVLEITNRDDKDAMLMLRALKNEDQQSGFYLKYLSRIQKYLSLMNTMYSPGFAIYNFERDISAAMINVGSTGIAGKEKNIRKLIKSSMKTIYKVERDKGSDSKYDRFREAGGKIEWSDAHQSAREVSELIETELAYAEGKKPTMKTIKAWGQWIGDVNTSAENAIRFAAFQVAISEDVGMSDAKAGQLASDLTVDFTKHGAAGPLLNSLYLFANASIQGNYRLLRGLVKSKKVQKRAAGIVLAGFVQGLWLAMCGDDDIEDHVRQRFAIFKIPGMDIAPKIALPWGFSVLWNMGDEVARFATDPDYNVIKGSSRIAKGIMESFNPIAAGTVLQTVMPTLGDPLAMAYENRNWFGGPLMPETNPFEKVPTPDSQKYWKSTSAPSKWIASTINNLTGGDRVEKGVIDFSPETLDMMVDFVGGGAFRFVKDVALIPQRAYTGDLQIRSVPLLRRVFHEPSDRMVSTKYYDRMKKVLTVEEQLKVYHGTAKHGGLKQSKITEFRMIDYTNRTEKRLRKLRSAKRKTENPDSIKKYEEKIKRIQEAYNNHYDKTVD